MLIGLHIAYGCFHDAVAEFSYNRARRAHKIFAVWSFTDEVCQVLFWTNWHVIILNVPEIYLEKKYT